MDGTEKIMASLKIGFVSSLLVEVFFLLIFLPSCRRYTLTNGSDFHNGRRRNDMETQGPENEAVSDRRASVLHSQVCLWTIMTDAVVDLYWYSVSIALIWTFDVMSKSLKCHFLHGRGSSGVFPHKAVGAGAVNMLFSGTDID